MSARRLPSARRPPAGVRRRRFLYAVAEHSLLIVVAVAFVAPFVFMLSRR